MSDFPLTQVDLDALTALGRYRLLTVQSMIRAGVARDATHLGARLRALHKAKILEHTGPVFVSGQGRLPAFWWLSEKGAEILSMEIGQPVKRPRTKAVSARRNQHLEGIGRTAIMFDKLCEQIGAAVASYSFEFEYSGNRGEAAFERATALRLTDALLIPDMLTSATLKDGRARPVALEYENGSGLSDGRNFLAKLPSYAKALSAEVQAIEKRLGLVAPPRVLVVCADDGLLQSIRNNWPSLNDPRDAAPFYLQTIQAWEANPMVNWYRIGSAPSPLFPSQ